MSHCGCIPFRPSATHDTGLRAETVVPGFAVAHDLEDVIAAHPVGTALLISATGDDKWSRGAEDFHAAARGRCELALSDGAHVFTAPMRARAYEFLGRRLGR